ncbi:MAG: 23S rRNA (adenine(2503)-C(2))-methyltransferase RlmN [Chlamydiales bacterium]|nr:23S rRNA (adenine(2503)-C(2))-methyltransferase RlmN [Chlamydiales bacterium]
MHAHEFSLEQWNEWFQSHGEKAFRSKQILQWVYGRLKTDWEEMTDLNKPLRELLAASFHWEGLSQKSVQHSQDGETIKFLWELSDGKLVESVLICSKDRRTVCVSSQVGCPAKCAFCASGKEGLIRNLTAGEIIEQVYAIHRFLEEKKERVSHVVFMGMGEPFENYENVLKAIRLLIDPLRLNISQRRITVSTVGVIEGISRFMQEDLSVNLVLSLHAPNQHIRKKIIPYARKYPIEDVIRSMLEYARTTRRDITYEYTLIAGINDQKEHAEELGKLLARQPCTVNLIPYNPVQGLHLQRPERENIEDFRAILEKHGLVVTWRYTKGKDIAAACGQLALQHQTIENP